MIIYGLDGMRMRNDVLKFLFLDLNSFFASVEQQENPLLRGKPVAVVPVETDATCAIAASYEAKQYGISTGTPIYEAKAMCPELVCVLADHQRYVDYHHRILAEVDKHLPVFKVESTDEMSCQLMGRECEESYAVALAERIKMGIRTHVGDGIRCSVGVSTNRFLAKLATDLKKPDGLTVLRPEEVLGRMRDAPLSSLCGVGKNMHRRLLGAGIGDMETLWRATPEQLRAVWGGVEGERFWYKLHGFELPETEVIPRTIGHSHVLAPQWRSLDNARIVAQRLLQKAASRLRRKQYYARKLVLGVRLESGGKRVGQAVMPPLCDTMGLQKIMLHLWQELGLNDDSDERVKKIGLSFVDITSTAKVTQQLDMFAMPQDAHVQACAAKERLSRAMDTLNQRYGRDSVVQGFVPDAVRVFSGTKIAFTRIPDVQEFFE